MSFATDIDFIILKQSGGLSKNDIQIIPKEARVRMAMLGTVFHIVSNRNEVRQIKPEMLKRNTTGIILPDFYDNPEAKLILEELILTYDFASLKTAGLRSALEKLKQTKKG